MYIIYLLIHTYIASSATPWRWLLFDMYIVKCWPVIRVREIGGIRTIEGEIIGAHLFPGYVQYCTCPSLSLIVIGVICWVRSFSPNNSLRMPLLQGLSLNLNIRLHSVVGV
ncbi:hypothetical protein GGS26DRAFT_544447 [Hypomontagnella submonticulosa]|nr:hypothetical protein GGS26DRAFT_544447 [Hypomontagnella submonticulosa]